MCSWSSPRELTLEELLGDPVVKAVMARDHVTPDEVRALFRRLLPGFRRSQ
jgi:hypothetical protein